MIDIRKNTNHCTFCKNAASKFSIRNIMGYIMNIFLRVTTYFVFTHPLSSSIFNLKVNVLIELFLCHWFYVMKIPAICKFLLVTFGKYWKGLINRLIFKNFNIWSYLLLFSKIAIIYPHYNISRNFSYFRKWVLEMQFIIRIDFVIALF